MIKCKGCAGTIEYVPIEDLRGTPDYFNGGPAIAHIPAEPCQWFLDTPASKILAYLNVATYKAKQT